MHSPARPVHPVPPPASLLTAEDPPPVALANPAGSSPFLLTGDHAGKAFPKSLDFSSLSPADRARHIACDIGVREIGLSLAARLDATFIHQIYSRLVIDCNRAPDAADAIPPLSDGTVIAANTGLAPAAATARITAIHEPYQAAIAALIDARTAAGLPTILVALHSFTPVMAGVARPWDIGILHDDGEAGGDPRFARAMLAALTAQGGFLVGDNEPYRMDGTDHSVPRHAFARGLPYVEVEFRQDHIGDPAGIALWAERFACALEDAAQGWRRAAESGAGWRAGLERGS